MNGTLQGQLRRLTDGSSSLNLFSGQSLDQKDEHKQSACPVLELPGQYVQPLMFDTCLCSA